MDRDIDYVVLLDGDGQHLPEEILASWRLPQKLPLAFSVGNRMQDTHDHAAARKWTNLLLPGNSAASAIRASQTLNADFE